MPKSNHKSGGTKVVPKTTKAAKKPALSAPPAQLLDLVQDFLSSSRFTDAHKAFKQQRSRNGWDSPVAQMEGQTLVTVYETWKSQRASATAAVAVAVAVAESPDSEIDGLTDSSSADSSDDADSDLEMEDAAPAAPANVDDSTDSTDISDNSDISDSEDEDKGNKGNKDNKGEAKTEAAASDSADLSSESDFESSSIDGDSEQEAEKPGLGHAKDSKPAATTLLKRKTSFEDNKGEAKTEAAASDSADLSSESDFESSSIDGDSEQEAEKPGLGHAKDSKPAATNLLKRKTSFDHDPSLSESSRDSAIDSSGDDDSSSEDEVPQVKKQKVKQNSSDLEISYHSDRDGDNVSPRIKPSQPRSIASDSDSNFDSSSSVLGSDRDIDSDSDINAESAQLQKAAGTKLPESGSSSYLSSDSEVEASQRVEKQQRLAAARNESDSSVTMGKTSPQVFPVSALAPLPPDPSKKGKRDKDASYTKKAQNEPFSRVRRDLKVEEKFRSNAFADNSHDWGRKAHEDLIVTRGKGFTKEKNKKKRGSYRGGFIDVNAKKGLKFAD